MKQRLLINFTVPTNLFTDNLSILDEPLYINTPEGRHVVNIAHMSTVCNNKKMLGSTFVEVSTEFQITGVYGIDEKILLFEKADAVFWNMESAVCVFSDELDTIFCNGGVVDLHLCVLPNDKLTITMPMSESIKNDVELLHRCQANIDNYKKMIIKSEEAMLKLIEDEYTVIGVGMYDHSIIVEVAEFPDGDMARKIHFENLELSDIVKHLGDKEFYRLYDTYETRSGFDFTSELYYSKEHTECIVDDEYYVKNFQYNNGLVSDMEAGELNEDEDENNLIIKFDSLL